MNRLTLGARAAGTGLILAGVLACEAQPPVGEPPAEARHFRVEVAMTDSRLDVGTMTVDAGEARPYTAPSDDLHVTVIGENEQSLAELALYDPLRRRLYGPADGGGGGRGQPPQVPGRRGGTQARPTPGESYEVVPEAKFVLFVPFDPSASALQITYKKGAGLKTRVSLAKLVAQCRGPKVSLPCGAPAPK